MKQTNTPIIVGHGVTRGSIPENSRELFTWAIKHGASEIETDTRVSGDGIAVQYHNALYTDKTGEQHRLDTRSLSQIRQDRPEIMTLAELIKFVNHRARLLIEIKSGEPTEPVIRTIKHYLQNGWLPNEFSFTSFDFAILKQLHEAFPEIDCIVAEKWSAVRAIARARKLNTRYLNMSQQWLWWGFILWAARHNYQIYSYPPSRSRLKIKHEKPAKWVRFGLYGIITDDPKLFK